MLAPGEKLNQRYAIIRMVSTGLMSTVYEAEDTAIKRRVVLKELNGKIDHVSPARIEREVSLYSRLRHPGVLELLDVVVQEATVYLIFPFLTGVTLADLIRRGPLPLKRAAKICSEIADAVAYIHSQGIVHRDLKPANIMVGGDRATVMDFGIAKRVEEQESLELTRSGQTLGTPLYMPPEALSNQPIGPAADVYSLGVVFFETFARVPPFSGRNFAELVANRLNHPPPPLSQLRPDAPPSLSALVGQMMETDPARRPTAAAVCSQLLEIVASAPPELAQTAEIRTPLPVAPAAPVQSFAPAPPPAPVFPPPARAVEAPSPMWDLERTLEMKAPAAAKQLVGRPPASPAPVSELAKTVIVKDREISQTLKDNPEREQKGFFFDELSRQVELKRSRDFYRIQLSADYGHLMFQAKVSFWLWVLFSMMGFAVFLVGIVLLYYGKWQEGGATLVSESIVVFIQKLFKDREDEYRERAAKKNRHVELGNLWNLAAQSLDGLDPAMRREKLSKLTDALIEQVAGESRGVEGGTP